MPNSCTTWPNRETLWHQRLLPLPAPLLSKAVMNYPGHGICTHTDRPTMFVIPAYRLSFRERALGPISPYLSQLTVIYGRAAVSDHATIKFSASKLQLPPRSFTTCNFLKSQMLLNLVGRLLLPSTYRKDIQDRSDGVFKLLNNVFQIVRLGTHGQIK